MNIVIVGGGTAGWLTALYAQKIFPEKNIILVESEEYGILGAGEGSTPNFVHFLKFLEISIVDLIKNCNSTIKNGIKFTNWSNEQDYYFHPFESKSEVSNDYNFLLNNHYIENDANFSHFCASFQDHSLKDYSFIEKISNQLKVPYIQNSETGQLDLLSEIAVHFDAKLLANYLRSVGEQRGILVKEGIVQKIFSDADGYINKIKTNKEEILCDFIFDCSGFKKFIIGNYYKSSWKSHSKNLPAKKAIPFFLKIDENIPPYTEAIAMNFGWMWKIPLQDRYGCGYVFDSDYISDEDAVKEIEKYLGFEPIYPRKDKGAFNFEAGCFESIWIKNCLAVGLSSGFIEPLEATSIMQQIVILQKFFSDKENITTKNDFIKKRFNQLYVNETQEIVDFLYLHYVTNKKNNNFWKNFIKNNKMPNRINYILNVCKEKVLIGKFDLYDSLVFQTFSYYYILIGNKIINKENLKGSSKLLLDNTKMQNYNYILKQQEIKIPKCLTHNLFIDTIKL